ARDVSGSARPDDRVDGAADDRRRPRRPRSSLVGRHRVPPGVDRLDPDLRQARRHVRAQARVPGGDSHLPCRVDARRPQPDDGRADRVSRLQGIGAGGLMVGAQAIIADIVPPRERGRYMGLIGSVFAVASVAGPLLGGFLVDSLSWRWVFYVNLPVGALAVLIVVTRLHLHTPTVRHQIDLLGAALLSAGVALLILVTTWGGSQYAWGSA